MERETRRRLYMFFARAFSYPEKKEDYVKNLEDILGDGKGPAEKLFEELENIEEERLKEEFTRLFVNSYPTTPCPPFESAQLEGTLVGSPSHSVEEIYARYGLESTDLPDYIGSELEFMAFLLGLPQEEEVKEEQRRFLKEHILNWIPGFCESVYKNTRIGFFKELSRILKAFLEKEKKNVEV